MKLESKTEYFCITNEEYVTSCQGLRVGKFMNHACFLEQPGFSGIRLDQCLTKLLLILYHFTFSTKKARLAGPALTCGSYLAPGGLRPAAVGLRRWPAVWWVTTYWSLHSPLVIVYIICVIYCLTYRGPRS